MSDLDFPFADDIDAGDDWESDGDYGYCEACAGTGYADEDERHECPFCDGLGEWLIVED